MTLLIYNPVSGKSIEREQMLGRIVRRLSENGCLVTVYQTRGRGDAGRFVEKMKGDFDEIIVCGGDGTLHEVINGLIRSKREIPLGYIPTGSTNDYAKNLGINKRNALSVISEKHLEKLDVGSLNGELFTYVAAFGNFTDISFATDQQIKNNLGYMAYILTALTHIPDIKPFHAKLHTQDGEAEDDFALGMFTNAYYTAGFKNPSADRVDLRDGKLEYTLIRMPSNPRDLSEIIGGLLNGIHDSQWILAGSGDRFLIESDMMAWTLDGENGGMHDRCEISVLPGAVSIYVG